MRHVSHLSERVIGRQEGFINENTDYSVYARKLSTAKLVLSSQMPPHIVFPPKGPAVTFATINRAWDSCWLVYCFAVLLKISRQVRAITASREWAMLVWVMLLTMSANRISAPSIEIREPTYLSSHSFAKLAAQSVQVNDCMKSEIGFAERSSSLQGMCEDCSRSVVEEAWFNSLGSTKRLDSIIVWFISVLIGPQVQNGTSKRRMQEQGLW